MSGALDLLWVPFLACLVLAGIHVYLGLHVLARGVIFVDLALAQIAALGVTIAFLAGHPIQSDAAYYYALAFTIGGAVLFAASRIHRAPVPQEAIIGIVYAVSAALAVLVVDRAPQGSEHIKQLLIGSILTVTPREVGTLALLYAGIGALHWLIRRPLLEISFRSDPGATKRRWTGWWDFLFYVSFGIVVTSSVRIAGVLLVFSYLIVPAVAAALLTNSIAKRLFAGWALAVIVSVLGLSASYQWDLPTGAAVVSAFGAALGVVALGLGIKRLLTETLRRGFSALLPVGTMLFALVGLAGSLLVVFPRMDHHWLNWLEQLFPSIETTFLTPKEREAYSDSVEGVKRGEAEVVRLKGLLAEVQWGTKQLASEQEERARQYVTSRGEIAAGERMVLAALRLRARERQRFVLGIPLLLAGAAGSLLLFRLKTDHRIRPLPQR